MESTWYELNKKFIETLLFSIRETRLSEQLSGLFNLKPVEDCILLLIGDNVRLKERIVQLEKTIEELKKSE